MASTLSFSDITTMHVGGPIRHFVAPASRDEFIGAVMAADDAKLPLCVIGGGSNLLVSDEPFDGVVVRDARRRIEVLPALSYAKGGHDGSVVRVRADAGVHWDDFVAFCVAHGYAGVEGLSGIPGTVGASVVQNIGAYGQEVSTSVISVEAWDRKESECVTLVPAQMEFGYRSSALKRSMYSAPGVPVPPYFPTPRYVVLSVTFGLQFGAEGTVAYDQLAHALGVQTGERRPIASIRTAVLEIRAKKQMLEDPARYANPWMANTTEASQAGPSANKAQMLGAITAQADSSAAPQYDRWSCGSFFTNPILSAEQAATLPQDAPKFPAALTPTLEGIKTSAAWLIEHAGFPKGYALAVADAGGDASAAASAGQSVTAPAAPAASLSTVHTLALTNRGVATSEDIVRLAQAIQAGVESEFGVHLVPEPVVLGLDLH